MKFKVLTLETVPSAYLQHVAIKPPSSNDLVPNHLMMVA